MKLYLIRHGETDWNLAGRLQGQEDIPLNAAGRRQALACSIALKNVPLQCIQTSPLRRALKTAELISAQQPCPLVINPSLIERDYGRLSGLSPEERAAFQAQGIPDGAEPWDTLAARALQAAEKLADQYPGGTIAAVSHGAWINALLAVLSNRAIGTGKTQLKNACISLLNKTPDGWAIEFFNATAEDMAANLL